MTNLTELSAKATQGVWTAEVEAEPEPDEIANVYICHPMTTCNVTVVATMGTSVGVSERQRRIDAAYITALVNAPRAGRLVEVPEDAVERMAKALCQNALCGKICPCIEFGVFRCANEHPGNRPPQPSAH